MFAYCFVADVCLQCGQCMFEFERSVHKQMARSSALLDPYQSFDVSSCGAYVLTDERNWRRIMLRIICFYRMGKALKIHISAPCADDRHRTVAGSIQHPFPPVPHLFAVTAVFGSRMGCHVRVEGGG